MRTRLFLGGLIAENGGQVIKDKVAVLGPNDGAVKLFAPDGFRSQATIDESGAAARRACSCRVAGVPITEITGTAKEFVDRAEGRPARGQADRARTRSTAVRRPRCCSTRSRRPTARAGACSSRCSRPRSRTASSARSGSTRTATRWMPRVRSSAFTMYKATATKFDGSSEVVLTEARDREGGRRLGCSTLEQTDAAGTLSSRRIRCRVPPDVEHGDRCAPPRPRPRASSMRSGCCSSA